MSAQADTNCHNIFNVVSLTWTHLSKIGAACHVVPTCCDMSATFPAKVLPGNVRHVLWWRANLQLELVVQDHDGNRRGGIESSQFLHSVLEGGAGIVDLVDYEHAFAANQGAEGTVGLVK